MFNLYNEAFRKTDARPLMEERYNGKKRQTFMLTIMAENNLFIDLVLHYEQPLGAKGIYERDSMTAKILVSVSTLYPRLRATKKECFTTAYETYIRGVIQRWRWLAKNGRRVRAANKIREFYFQHVLRCIYSPHSRGRKFMELYNDPLLKNVSAD